MGVNNEEYYFNFTIFLWSYYFIFYCIVVRSNGCGIKYIHYDLLIEEAFMMSLKLHFIILPIHIFNI